MHRPMVASILDGMSMFNESLAAWIEEAKGVGVACVKIAGCVVGAWAALRVLAPQADPTVRGVVLALVLWGGVMRFLGPYMTGKGFWAGVRGSWAGVDVATPVSIWTLGGWVAWGLAAAVGVWAIATG